jgi:bifunctional enzyme CysN/CysC
MASETELIATDIEAYLRRYQEKELLRFVAVGSVDDGKSTLIGRLLFDTGSVYEDQLAAVRKASQMAGTDVDLSLLTDGLAAEREQGITIDVAYRYFSTARRKFIIADTPGHIQYTRNMVTGASTANVAIILIDARLGVLQQSRRHAYIASLLGIPRLAVCVNKMDLVAYDRAVFARIQAEFSQFTAALSFTDVVFFPISALRGDNCVRRSDETPWHAGPTVLEYLESVPVHEVRDLARLRFPVQSVSRPSIDYRGFAGRVASGVVRAGDVVMVLPSGTISRVKSIDSFDGESPFAFAGQSVTLRLEDELDVSRGDMIVHGGGAHRDPPRVTRTFDAHLVWMHDAPLDPARSYLLKHTTQTVRAEIDRVHWRKDMDTLAENPAEKLGLNDIGRVTITAHRALFLDAYVDNRETGSFILIDALTNNTVGAGMMIAAAAGGKTDLDTALRQAEGDARPQGASRVSAGERRARFGVSPGVVLLAGEGGGATREVARAVEQRLFAAGAAAVVFDSGSAAGSLAAARAVCDAGLLAIVASESAVLDEPAAAGWLEGRRLLFVRIVATRDGSDAAAEGIVRRLSDGGWLAVAR